MTYYDLDEFDTSFLQFLGSLQTKGSFVRISASGKGLHFYTKEKNSLSFSNTCRGFQFFAKHKSVLWDCKEGKQVSKWIKLTEELKALLLSSRNPTVALTQYLE